MRKKLFISSAILLLLIGMMCCILPLMISSTNFNSAYKEYKKAQIAATWFIDAFGTASAQDSMKKVGNDVLMNNLHDMEIARDKMQKSVITEKQKKILHSVSIGCENIKFLIFAKGNVDHLSADHSQRLRMILEDEASCRIEYLEEQ